MFKNGPGSVLPCNFPNLGSKIGGHSFTFCWNIFVVCSEFEPKFKNSFIQVLYILEYCWIIYCNHFLVLLPKCSFPGLWTSHSQEIPGQILYGVALIITSSLKGYLTGGLSQARFELGTAGPHTQRFTTALRLVRQPLLQKWYPCSSLFLLSFIFPTVLLVRYNISG